MNSRNTIINFYFSVILFLWVFVFHSSCNSVSSSEKENQEIFQPKTYCNPIDIDYTYSVVSTARGLSYRSGADPAVVRHKDEFYLFVTRSQGYWYSKDLRSWEFIQPDRWYFESSNAPGAWSTDSNLLVLANPFGYMSLISATDPFRGNWEAQPSIIPFALHDPAIFVDDDGRTYLYEGSSNTYPILGVELDPTNYYLPKGDPQEMFSLKPEERGWERFGENHVSKIGPFMEGPWMTKHNGIYYLEYAAPGTQWNVYGDGVYTSDSPLGPFEYAPYNPVSYKPGGFIKGAGHGSTVKDKQGNYWHFGTMRISVNYLFERRLGMFPAGFEEDGQMYVNTAYGDYPHFLPGEEVEKHRNRFTGWMLLSYKKPVKASSVKGDETMKRLDESASGYMLPLDSLNFDPANVTNEDIRSFWVAESNKAGEWLEVNLEKVVEVYALQINYQDFNSNIFGKPDTLFHQFLLEYSSDGKNWKTAVDYSKSKKDQPNCYVELAEPVNARFIKFTNIHVPTPNLAISGLRVFGKGTGELPAAPANFIASVDEKDKRNAFITWSPVENAFGYTLYWGIAADKLNNSVMIYEDTSYQLRALNLGQTYFFEIEAFNENGISRRAVTN